MFQALTILCQGLDGKPLIEVDLSDNALGEKGVRKNHVSHV